MKKILGILLLLAFCHSIQAGVLQKSTAKEIIIWLKDSTTNQPKTGVAAASVTVRLVKEDMTTSSFTPTASGGSNDWTEIGNGAYRQELTTTQTDTAGNLEVGVTVAGAIYPETNYTIYPTATWNQLFVNGSATSADIRLEIDTNSTQLAAIKVKTDFLPSATAGANGGLFIAGTNASTTVTGSFSTTFTGNLTGSIGSVAAGGIAGNALVDGLLTSVKFASDTRDAFAASYLASEVETGFTVKAVKRLVAAAVGGKVSGSGTATIKFRNLLDSVDAITATVDGTGNRTALTYNLNF